MTVAVIILAGALALFVAAMRWLGRHVTRVVWRADLAEKYRRRDREEAAP